MPAEWVDTVRRMSPQALEGEPEFSYHYAAQLLWQRGFREPESLAGFLDPGAYEPTSAWAFGAEMVKAVERLRRAFCPPAQGTPTCSSPEKVAIWGDFDADGITATAVLWEALGHCFPPETHLRYYIPNRFTESHGLSRGGIDQLADWGCQLLITCDTGSTSLAEIDYAHQRGMEVIITDHHTLPGDRPPVVAILNPRQLPPGHPLGTLSGVAVAYKLMEAFYASLDAHGADAHPSDPQTLLDLVAIGLIADLVELTGDCRYLAQRGLERLQQHLDPAVPSPRPGIAELLTLCKRTGDRPSDISFGIGPRINAVSRIHGDAHFCVELLTSRDVARCKTLALEAELANTRRKTLQRDLLRQVNHRLAGVDLATTQVIVLADEQWSAGILGLVAGQVAQQYGRPTLLLSLDPIDPNQPDARRLARGSARSLPGLDLYELFQSQAHLLHRYGGHPLAAGLSLPVENLPLFTAALNRQVREILGGQAGETGPVLGFDLTVTVAELGKDLFRELKRLEPYGMGNPVPRLRVQQVWFTDVRRSRLQDLRRQKVGFVKTDFLLWDETVREGFPGEWWDHAPEDVPKGRVDVLVELDYNTYQRQYKVRLIDWHPAQPEPGSMQAAAKLHPMVDWRRGEPDPLADALVMTHCPVAWAEWQPWLQQAMRAGQPLAIAYAPPLDQPPGTLWAQLVGIAKYVSRTGKPVALAALQERLGLSAPTLALGLKGLTRVGFQVEPSPSGQIQITGPGEREGLGATDPASLPEVQIFLASVQEEQFRHRYFYQVPIATLEHMVSGAGNLPGDVARD